MASHETQLAFYNQSAQGVTITVSQIDSYDWDGQSRPDVNFQNIYLAPGNSYSQREEVNAYANSAWVCMSLSLSDGTALSYRFDQYDAYNGISPTPRVIPVDGNGGTKHTVVQRVDKSAATNSFTLYSDL